jgi:predicted dehydrogenase
MNYAIIGCGRISRNHIQSAIYNGLEIKALCDLDENKAQHLIDHFKLIGVKIYNDYKSMLLSEHLDLVAVATNHSTHYEIARSLIVNKINVLIEKPAVIDLKHGNELLELSEINKVKVSVCHQNRFNRSVVKLRDAILQNRLGEIFYISVNVRWFRDRLYYSQDAWRGSKKERDGVLMNQAIHNIDLLLWIMNSEVSNVTSVRKNYRNPEIDMEDFALAIVEFKNGSSGIIEASTIAFPENLEETITVLGSKGTVKIGGTSLNKIEEWRVSDETEPIDEIIENSIETPPNVYGFGHQMIYSDLIKAIENDSEPKVSLEEALRAVKVILDIYES